MSEELEQKDLEGIAIIGMSGRFPGAKDIYEFWENIKQGKECITSASDEELLEQGVSKAQMEHPRYVKRYAAISDIDKFDSEFFKVSPKEADLTDPQHRLFLEHSWKTIEDAGYNPENLTGKVGVFGGTSASSYLLYNMQNNPNFIESVGGIQTLMHGFDKDHLATKVSYKLNLTGPSITVQTACSSSMVATILACQSLLSYQCDMALAGGVTVNVPDRVGYLYQEGSIFSADGSCRPFAKDASGTIFGSGLGIVLLKRLDEALEDGDHIYAVIKGFAMNNDGAEKVGYTAPGISGQAEVITEALEFAGICPETIGYIEAHGTGTSLGDPIEVAALTQVYRNYTDKLQYSALGSVKANIGHLNAAAGITGLIKGAMILKNKQIPPSLVMDEVNPELHLQSSPFYINNQLKEWTTTGETPRRVAVSSFGIGGTNGHIILEEAPEALRKTMEQDNHLLVLSARDAEGLEQASQELLDYLKKPTSECLPKIAKTLQLGRKHFEYRKAITCSDKIEAVNLLQRQESSSSALVAPEQEWSVVFMFPGQGTQYLNMTKDLYSNLKIFREELDRCREILRSIVNFDIYQILFAEENDELHDTWYTQPILFSVEYALAQTYIKLGITPEALIGHSLGEYVAACISGIFSLESALKVVVQRGMLFKKIDQGSMLGVFATEEELQAVLSSDSLVDIAAKNGPKMFVVAGADQDIQKVMHLLDEQHLTYQKLRTSHAFHSRMMDPIMEEFAENLESIPIYSPQIPIISNLSGEYADTDEGLAFTPEYWTQHMRQPVQFSKGVSSIQSKFSKTIFLEVGPGRVLGNLVKQNTKETQGQAVFLSSMNSSENASEYKSFLSSLGQLWTLGFEVNWEQLYGDHLPLTASLPTYPFKKKVHWIKQVGSEDVLSSVAVGKDHYTQIMDEEKNVYSKHERPQLKNNYVEPETELQANLLAMWEELLGIKNIGIYDNFFDLGGHSLMATQLLSRIREIYPIELTLEQMFSAPNVSQLATLMENELVKLLETMTDDEAKKLL